MAVRRRELKVNQGGLMRCCLLSIQEWHDEDPEAEVTEETLPCKFHSRRTMVIEDGVIRWNRGQYFSQDAT